MARTERLLMGPGPSNAPREVLSALAEPLLGHLDPVFLEVLDEVAARLREAFRTKNRVTFAVPGTGSAGMEASLVNLLEPGDEAIIGVNGVFGERLADVASRTGARVVRVEAEWGDAVGAERLSEVLEQRPDAKVVALVHAETSTGVAQPLESIVPLVRGHGALFVLDTVTSLAGMPVEADRWGVDVTYSGTQKCLSVPPGLAPITFSERAVDAVRSRTHPVQSWYLDLTMLERYWGSERVYHHTAPIAMLRALHTGLGLVLEEGLEARWERHRKLGAILAGELEERGFRYVPARGERLPMLHCVRLPDELEEAPLRRRLLEEHGIEVGGGLGRFAGSCWRIGLMGETCREENIERLLDAIDGVMRS